VNWAKYNGYLALDHPGLPRFAGKVKPVPKRVGVYNAVERERLIKKADPMELPMTLIKAYTPIRAKECGLACWESIDWQSSILMVWADQAKKREPRAIHLPRELCERLRPLAQERGRIYPYDSFYKVGPRLAKRAGLTWIRNGWRTTTISHLQAAVNDLPRVAEEAGTSVRKIRTNYLKLVSPHDGRAYFGLHQGERHPIEPGYNAEHYGISPAILGKCDDHRITSFPLNSALSVRDQIHVVAGAARDNRKPSLRISTADVLQIVAADDGG
jgi:integrase